MLLFNSPGTKRSTTFLTKGPEPFFNIGIQVHLHLLINQRKGSFPVSTYSSSTMIPGVNASRFLYFIFAMAVDTLKRNKLAFFHNPDLD